MVVLQTSPSRPAQLQLTGHAALTGPPMAAPAAEQLLGSMGQQLHQRLDRREQAADLAMLRSILFSSIGPEVGAALAWGHALHQPLPVGLGWQCSLIAACSRHCAPARLTLSLNEIER